MSLIGKFYLTVLLVILIDCNSIKGKAALDRAIKVKEEGKGFVLSSYNIINQQDSSSTTSTFYFDAHVVKDGQPLVIRDSVIMYKTGDGILIDR